MIFLKGHVCLQSQNVFLQPQNVFLQPQNVFLQPQNVFLQPQNVSKAPIHFKKDRFFIKFFGKVRLMLEKWKWKIYLDIEK